MLYQNALIRNNHKRLASVAESGATVKPCSVSLAWSSSRFAPGWTGIVTKQSVSWATVPWAASVRPQQEERLHQHLRTVGGWSPGSCHFAAGSIDKPGAHQALAGRIQATCLGIAGWS